jgi:hypothetical protein
VAQKECSPNWSEKYYYRPFVLKDHSSNYNMFLVGINPATGIPLTINPEDYVKSLLNIMILKNYILFAENHLVMVKYRKQGVASTVC